MGDTRRIRLQTSKTCAPRAQCTERQVCRQLRRCRYICVDECRYLEAQFTEGMSWNSNIHIDHIVPCASFDLSDPEQQRRCFHYTNLQVLWWRENLEKSDKITPQAAQREWNGARWVDKL